MRRLTNRQARFIDEYLVDLNATSAAVRAGYSKRTARQAGAENLSKPVISNEIAKQTKALAERNRVTVDDYIDDLKQRISADVADIFDPNGNLLPPDQWPSVWRRGLVTRVRITEEKAHGQVTRQATSIRFADRVQLKYLLGKHLGMFK